MRLPPMRLPAEITPASLTVLIDSREQHPFNFPAFKTKTIGLPSGDYSVEGLQSSIALERKSLSDLVACCGAERIRFEHELQRLLAYTTRCVIVEASWHDLEAGQWRSRIRHESVVGSVLGWIAQGIPFVLCGDRPRAELYAGRLLFIAARREWRRLRTFAAGQSDFHETSTSDDIPQEKRNGR